MEVWIGVDECAQGEHGPGHETDNQDREVVPGRLVMHVLIGGEALEIVFEEELAVKGGVAALDGDVPGQNHHEIKDQPGPARWFGAAASIRGAAQ